MNYRISDLKNFVETAQCNTMASAARVLGITQPSLSESIQRLEYDLQTKLFYRSRSGIQLTTNGRAVFQSSKIALSSLLDVKAACDNTPSFEGRRITIGCHPVAASYTLPKALSLLEQKTPDYKIQIRQGASREIQNLIQMGQVDIGVVINPVPVPDLIIKNLGVDEVCVWSNIKNPSRIIGHFEMFQTQHILRKWKSRPQELINTENLELVVRLVEQGIGFGIIPERAVKLVGIPLKKHTELPVFRDVISLIYRPEFGKNLFEKEVISTLVKSI
jgi:DNA-binding transcriptional LysR family regulator